MNLFKKIFSSTTKEEKKTSEEKDVTTDLTHESDGESDGKDSVTSATRSQKRRKTSAYARDGSWRPTKDSAGDEKDDHWLDEDCDRSLPL